MTAAVGYPTLRLVRESIGELDLFTLGLDPGQWLQLDAEQTKKILAGRLVTSALRRT